MDRAIIFPGQVPLETDLLRTNQSTMTAIAKLSAAVFGTAGMANGFATTQSVVPAMTVLVAAGEVYQLANLDSTAYSSLAADTAHSIVKQGLQLDPVTLSIAAPGTAGFSINYLIEVSYQDSDTGLTVLPYYNASNPSVAYSGPANSGASQPTKRAGIVSILAKAGVAATTGSQTTPAPDAGYFGLYVVTVANGASTVINANISQYINAPFLPKDLVHAMQQSTMIVGVDTGAANACIVNYTPAITALVDGMVLWYKAAAANTGGTTLNVNGLGVTAVLAGAHAALQGGEIVAAGKCQVVYNATLSSFVLIECTGGALQVGTGSASQQAVAVGQLFGGLKGIVSFTSSGSWVCPAGVTKAYLSACAGGGGGGGGGGGAGGNVGGSAGAGGSGQSVLRVGTTVTPGATYTVALGAAGGGGGTISSGSGSNGTAGGNTAISGTGVSIVCIAGGGGGGGISNNATRSAAGLAGTGAPAGSAGSDSNNGAGCGPGGTGGASLFGGGGGGGRSGYGSAQPGDSGAGYGSGGGGAGGTYQAGAGAGAIGGNGASGFCLIEW